VTDFKFLVFFMNFICKKWCFSRALQLYLEISDWIAHSNAVFDVEWMREEQKLLTASGDQTICLWDVPNKKKLLTFKGHSSSVRSVKYRPQDDGTYIIFHYKLNSVLSLSKYWFWMEIVKTLISSRVNFFYWIIMDILIT
jgi:WD40 repeat protein